MKNKNHFSVSMIAKSCLYLATSIPIYIYLKVQFWQTKFTLSSNSKNESRYSFFSQMATYFVHSSSVLSKNSQRFSYSFIFGVFSVLAAFINLKWTHMFFNSLMHLCPLGVSLSYFLEKMEEDYFVFESPSNPSEH